ncbi:MAG: glycosyltransferase family 4 protein [Chloroflexaceae bacterium]|nr:glycosyltransferase family 4 protein [Chloroflexaceae bacterium]
MPLSITLFRTYAEEGRTSIDIYAESLAAALHTEFPGECRALHYQPHLLQVGRSGDNPTPASLRVRVSRFAAYPLQARAVQGDINHIVDHGYGHLVHTLDAARTVVTVHDLIPLLQWLGKIPGAVTRAKPWLNLIPLQALPRAQHLIAVSEQTRQDLIEYCGCRPEQISVVYSGIDALFQPAPAEAIAAARQEWNMPDDGTRRILVVGSLFYKNIGGALQAVARLRQHSSEPVQVYKTGAATEEWNRTVAEHGLHDVAHCLGFLAREKLPTLYSTVDCLLFPSLYEGAGWPPLEAMRCGCPVVVSNRAALPEMVGDAALLVDPLDTEAMAAALHRALTDTPTRTILRDRGFERSQSFTWERAAQQTWEVYQRVRAHGPENS